VTDPLLIVGGGPAALAAARGYRAAGGEAAIVMATDDDRPPYRRPPLSKEYLRGELEAAALQLEEDGWYAAHGVEVVRDAVTVLDPEHRRALTRSGRQIAFAGAVLATGAQPTRPNIPGADDPAVHLLRRVGDSDALRDAVGPGTRVAVVGSGFVGCEVAASLALRGAQVTLVSDEPAPQAVRLGAEVGERLAGWLRELGVRLRLGHPVAGFVRDGAELRVAPAVGHAIPVDLVVLGTGIAPRDELARAAGLTLGPDERFVAVDETMATSDPAIRAAGDVTVARHALAGRVLHVEHWGDALAQGTVAGRALAGDPFARWDTPPGFWSTIGPRTLKHVAWGAGHDEVRVTDHGADAFTARYYARSRLVGVLTHDCDGDYDAGGRQIAAELA
jgi:3-phenylpropionate/trans-cinnamate dioxygenase ferredoxin reductase component